MSDRTVAHLVFADCPRGEVGALLGLLDDLHFDFEFDGEEAPEGSLALGKEYLSLEIPVGGLVDDAARIASEAPGAWFWAWEEPAYGHMGLLYRHVPQLGLWSAACDVKGEAFIGENEMLRALSEGPGHERVERALGCEHRELLAERLDICGDRVAWVPGLVWS